MASHPKLPYLPWYKWFPRDFAGSEDAAGLTLSEEGAVRRLLDHQWVKGSIPADVGDLANLCRVPVAEMESIWKRISRFFVPIDEPGRLRNERLQRQFASVIEEKALLSAAGSLGAAVRWGGHREGKAEPMAPRVRGYSRSKADTDADANPETPTKGRGMVVFAKLRKARVGTTTPMGIRYHLPPAYLNELDEPTRKTIEAVGGAHIIASTEDDRLPILRAQFAEMYVAICAASPGPGTEQAAGRSLPVTIESDGAAALDSRRDGPSRDN